AVDAAVRVAADGWRGDRRGDGGKRLLRRGPAASVPHERRPWARAIPAGRRRRAASARPGRRPAKGWADRPGRDLPRCPGSVHRVRSARQPPGGQTRHRVTDDLADSASYKSAKQPTRKEPDAHTRNPPDQRDPGRTGTAR